MDFSPVCSTGLFFPFIWHCWNTAWTYKEILRKRLHGCKLKLLLQSLQFIKGRFTLTGIEAGRVLAISVLPIDRSRLPFRWLVHDESHFRKIFTYCTRIQQKVAKIYAWIWRQHFMQNTYLQNLYPLSSQSIVHEGYWGNMKLEVSKHCLLDITFNSRFYRAFQSFINGSFSLSNSFCCFLGFPIDVMTSLKASNF